MIAQFQTPGLTFTPREDAYTRVVSAIQQDSSVRIAVPELSKLLGVKSTTLNARFRRQQVATDLVGRTTYVPLGLALDLVRLHKPALLGWPTLQQASVLTGVKPGTIKARCEKGRLEGYMDLTKRLRVNPAELPDLLLSLDRSAKLARAGRGTSSLGSANRAAGHRQRNGQTRPAAARPKTRFSGAPVSRAGSAASPARTSPMSARSLALPQSPMLPPALEPRIQIITEKDYGGLPFAVPAATFAEPARTPVRPARPDCLVYEPDHPLSVGECAVGKSIQYGDYTGRIARVIDDPFNPRIQVRFPRHDHPLMREVQLVVGKRSA